jgi:6-phosphogluconolactonase
MKSILKFIIIMCLFSMSQPTYAQISKSNMYNLLIGTYTRSGKSVGIYVYTFNAETGEFTYKSEAPGIKNPSFLVVSKDRKNVYSVSEVGGGGGVSAFSFDSSTGKLEFLNSFSSGGSGPCYVTVDDQKKYVFAGNYGGGSLCAIPVQSDDGSLGRSIQSIRHSGSSINREQDRARVHATVLSPDNRYLFVPDLGIDKVHIYNVDITKPNPLTPAEQPFVSVETGSGPRHFTFHPNGKFAYVIQEITGIVTAFDYKDGRLTTIQSVSMPSPDYKGPADHADAADIHISPDGRFLYGSLRGEINEIVIYTIDENGKLTYAGRQSTLGQGPRNFALDPTGTFLLVGNSRNDEIVIFKRDQNNGLLTDTGKRISVGSPVCLKFVEIN